VRHAVRFQLMLAVALIAAAFATFLIAHGF
jgi:hypothetical protein